MGKKYAGWDEEGDADYEIRKGNKQCAQIEKHGAGCKGATQQRMQRYFTCTCERSMSSVFKLAQHERLWPWRSEQGRA